jgi:hypothetical protein
MIANWNALEADLSHD